MYILVALAQFDKSDVDGEEFTHNDTHETVARGGRGSELYRMPTIGQERAAGKRVDIAVQRDPICRMLGKVLADLLTCVVAVPIDNSLN